MDEMILPETEMPMTDEEFIRKHPVGFCKVPDNLDAMPSLKASAKFYAPRRVDLRDYCGPTEDQGAKPWCAAYAATSWAENILWRKSDAYEHIDPTWVYAWAKQHDGDPNGDGTTLTAVLDAMRYKGTFDGTVCKTRVIGRGIDDIKFAIHRFGAILCGFNVTREWYGCRSTGSMVHDADGNPIILGTNQLPGIGGHAVLGCGYNGTGLMIQNSWGFNWGRYGFATVSWNEVERMFLYGSVLDNCLNGFEV